MPYRRYSKKTGRKNKRKRGLSTRAVKRIATMQSRTSLPASLRTYNTERISTNSNECSYNEWGLYTSTEMEALLQAYGPLYAQYNSGHTAVTFQNMPIDYDATNRAFSDAKLFFTNRAYTKFLLRNNDLIEQEIEVYEFICADDTSYTVMQEMQTLYDVRRNDAAADISTDLRVNIGMFKNKMDHWKFVRSSKHRLMPGDERVVYVKPGKGWFDSSLEALTGGTYVKNISKSFIVRLCGTLGHDTSDKSLIGRLACGMDVEQIAFQEFKSYTGMAKEKENASNSYDTITVGEQSHVDFAQEQAEV